MNQSKAERPNVENTTSKANRIDVKQPKLQSANAEAVSNMRENAGKPWDQRNWEQGHKDMLARGKYGDHSQVNGMKTYKKGAIYDE